MANLRDIRRRIKSVKNTAQITRAMQLVAAAKMKKAQDQAIAGREYSLKLSQTLQKVRSVVNAEGHTFFTKREGSKELVLLVSTDKGLCGALNTNLGRKVFKEISPEADLVTVGRKLRSLGEKLGRKVIADFTVKDPVNFAEARAVATFITDLFVKGEYDRVTVAYTNFVNTLVQQPIVKTLLPLSEIHSGHVGLKDDQPEEKSQATEQFEDIAFEPTPAQILETLLPLFINFEVYQLLLESRASEHSARMVAMKAATDNAKKFIKELTLEYNKLRQAAITAELLEITTAMKAME